MTRRPQQTGALRKRAVAADQRGAAFLLAIVASAVLIMLGTAFALLMSNELHMLERMTAYDQALYVAESGIEDLFYQRSKNQGDPCFPFTDDGTLTGAPGELINGNAATCDNDPATDADLSDPDKDDIPCWPYNEHLYANVITYGPNFYCHDGSDPVKCPSYAPLAVWPARPSGGPGWKDMDPDKPTPLDNAAQSSGQRYTTGMFTVCNDDSLGDDPATWNCLSPPCNRRVMRFSFVSVGEVETRPGRSVSRAVKVDVVDPTLYSGVIDKYVDLSFTSDTAIYGPVHINGWWDAKINQNVAILGGSLSPAALMMNFFHTPDIVSVSFPEPPTGDLQPFLSIGAQINWVHLPVRLEIPQVNWNQFEGRMTELYSDALGFYTAGSVELLKMENYDPGNMYNTQGAGGDEFPCSSSPQADAASGRHDTTPGDCRDMDFPEFCESGSGLDQTCCTRGAGPGRIHNCRRSGYQSWGEIAFDLFDINSGSYVTGVEPTHLGGSPGPRDRSLRYITQRIFDIHFSGGGCSFLNPFACLTRDINRPQFVFMGRHEFNNRVFIDGTMGMGTRTPYHTCGSGDGTFTFWCVELGPWNILGVTINFAFGVPHWHMGEARIRGELLVHGKLYMADYVRIDGGAIYADDHVIKDETSGMDLEISVSTLLCFLAGGGAVPTLCELLFAGTWNGIPIWFGLDSVIQIALPWWPYLNLTNWHDNLDFKSYLDIDGWNTAGVRNSGILYTRGDVWVTQAPGIDVTNMLLNLVVGSFAPFLEIQPALDPVRIWNGGAIIAGGTELSPGMYEHGNVYIGEGRRLDLLTYNPDTDSPDMGFVFARGALQVNGDIVNRELGFVDTCTAAGIFPTAGCAANGIFYSGGVSASTHPDADTKMFTRTGGKLVWNGGFQEYETTCRHWDEPDFSWDPFNGDFVCWASCLPGMCDRSEFNIRGFIFAGQVGGMPNVWFRLEQDQSVKHAAVTRRYYRSFVGEPVDWMEIEPPANVPRL